MSDDVRARTVLLDACVLVPIRLTTTLLELAEAGLFEVLWSKQILDEVEQSLPKVGLSREAATRRVSAMRTGFGAAAMVDNFEHLVNEMTCEVKDRHVLAAAVAGGADTLVTFNIKDFPTESTAGHGIAVIRSTGRGRCPPGQRRRMRRGRRSGAMRHVASPENG